jgi:hypothetical protein
MPSELVRLRALALRSRTGLPKPARRMAPLGTQTSVTNEQPDSIRPCLTPRCLDHRGRGCRRRLARQAAFPQRDYTDIVRRALPCRGEIGEHYAPPPSLKQKTVSGA